MPNSFEELCIMRAAAENCFARVLNPHIYIYIYIYMGGASVWSEFNVCENVIMHLNSLIEIYKASGHVCMSV